MKILVVLIAVFSFAGCASHRMRGEDVPTVEGVRVPNLRVTASEAKALSIDNYCLVDIYLRNLNTDWLRVKNVEIVGVKGADHFRVIVGPDLKQWRKSIALDFDLRIEKSKSPKERDRLRAQKAELAQYADEDHLYQPFGIPSQLQARKWLLFQFDKKADVSAFKFEITWLDDRRQTFEAALNKKEAL